MLPGWIAGHYGREEVHVDLEPVVREAGASLRIAEVTGLDPDRRRLHLDGAPSLLFDLLSLNVGSAPTGMRLDGAMECGLPVRPTEAFLSRLLSMVGDPSSPARALAGDRLRIAFVGGGVTAVEVALAVKYRLRDQGVDLMLFTEDDEPLSSLSPGARARLLRVLSRRGIRVRTKSRVAKVGPRGPIIVDGEEVEVDVTVLATGAEAPPWVEESGLALDPRGFVAVDAALRSTSHPHVFAAGDVSTVLPHPRPKAGVFAVRQGPPLHANLERALLDKEPRPFQPQSVFLTLVSTGDRYAVGGRGRWSFEGRWVWYLKDWIDRRWMSRWRL